MLLAAISNRLPLAAAQTVATMEAHAPAVATHMNAGTADVDRADVERVLTGAVDHFAVLVDRHQGRIVSHLTRLVGRADAEDLAQDTFVRAYQALDRYDPMYPFRGWLLIIASRLAANHNVKRRERLLGDDIKRDHGVHYDDPAHTIAEADAASALQQRLDEALATLPDDARALYELRFRQELSMAELAKHFAVSENTLKVRVHRLRHQLALRLGLNPAEAPQEG